MRGIPQRRKGASVLMAGTEGDAGSRTQAFQVMLEQTEGLTGGECLLSESVLTAHSTSMRPLHTKDTPLPKVLLA